MIDKISKYLQTTTKAAPLAVFRMFFGVMMLISIIRFWSLGWIEKLYLEPSFHFSFYGFEWVKPLGGWTYVLIAICGLSALMVALGWKYRWAIVVFFLSFTYIELMDKTTYLNHYYFVSVVSGLLIFVPAHSYFSVDAYFAQTKDGSNFHYSNQIPKWTIDCLLFFIAMVYIYAGLAKLNSDWMVEAMPLKIWLPSKFDLPVLGALLGKEWMHYGFSWAGALYDLCIPFLLLWRKTRSAAFVFVIIFHVLTRVLFPIGMFPYIMIVSALLFFDSGLHERIIQFLSKFLKLPRINYTTSFRATAPSSRQQFAAMLVGLILLIQVLFPWRYLLYPGELFWTEEGYRFSWRVMLMEKSGYAQFKIVDGQTGRWFYVDNSDFLTPFQEKQMSFQPDFILEYAHYLRDHFESQGHSEVAVYVDAQVALNGRLSTKFIDSEVNLALEKETFKHKPWIIPFQDEIKGL